MSKSAVSYARNLAYDEKEVQKSGNGFINVWIRRAELTGKVGNVEPEIDEQLPTSWAQIRDVLLRLLELNSPMINQVLADPENSVVVKNGLGLRDINIPGYDDRLKQLDEIQDIINGQMIEIDPLLDNHAAESAVCRSFLIGEVGKELKKQNPQAYEMVLMHYKMHMMVLAQTQPAQETPAEEGAENERRNPES